MGGCYEINVNYSVNAFRCYVIGIRAIKIVLMYNCFQWKSCRHKLCRR